MLFHHPMQPRESVTHVNWRGHAFREVIMGWWRGTILLVRQRLGYWPWWQQQRQWHCVMSKWHGMTLALSLLYSARHSAGDLCAYRDLRSSSLSSLSPSLVCHWPVFARSFQLLFLLALVCSHARSCLLTLALVGALAVVGIHLPSSLLAVVHGYLLWGLWWVCVLVTPTHSRYLQSFVHVDTAVH